jgi:hypothetical protein
MTEITLAQVAQVAEIPEHFLLFWWPGNSTLKQPFGR